MVCLGCLLGAMPGLDLPIHVPRSLKRNCSLLGSLLLSLLSILTHDASPCFVRIA